MSHLGILQVFPRQQHGLPLGFFPKTADRLHTTFPDFGLEFSPKTMKPEFRNTYGPTTENFNYMYRSISVKLGKLSTPEIFVECYCVKRKKPIRREIT